MKKYWAWLCCALLLWGCLPICTTAAEEFPVEEAPVVTDVVVTENDLLQWETVHGFNDSNGNPQRATGLILEQQISLSKSGSNLIISGTTVGSPDVEKVGFTYVKLQRLVNGTWQDYVTWSDLYSDGEQYVIGKKVAAASGYSYRVVCEHYAEETTWLFFTSSETIPNQTSTLYF